MEVRCSLNFSHGAVKDLSTHLETNKSGLTAAQPRNGRGDAQHQALTLLHLGVFWCKTQHVLIKDGHHINPTPNPPAAENPLRTSRTKAGIGEDQPTTQPMTRMWVRVRQKCGAARCPALQGSGGTARSLNFQNQVLGQHCTPLAAETVIPPPESLVIRSRLIPPRRGRAGMIRVRLHRTQAGQGSLTKPVSAAAAPHEVYTPPGVTYGKRINAKTSQGCGASRR